MPTAIETVTQRIERTVGNTYRIRATIKVDGVAVDITGDTLTFEYGDGTNPKTVIAGAITDGPNGVVDFIPDAADVATAGDYVYVINRDHAGEIATHLRGDFVLLSAP